MHKNSRHAAENVGNVVLGYSPRLFWFILSNYKRHVSYFHPKIAVLSFIFVLLGQLQRSPLLPFLLFHSINCGIHVVCFHVLGPTEAPERSADKDKC